MQLIKYISSVIRQKGESKNGGNKKTKYAKFSDEAMSVALLSKKLDNVHYVALLLFF